MRHGHGRGEGEQEEEGKGRFQTLWSALKNLRERLKGSEDSVHRDSQRSDNDCHCGVNSHGHQSKTIDSAIQFEGSSQKFSRDEIGANPFDGAKNSVEKSLPNPGPGGRKQKGVSPYSARKLAANVAIMSALIVTPMRGLLTSMSQATDFVEVACSPQSSLSPRIEELGYVPQRINFKEGYDLEKKSGTTKLREFLVEKKPKHTWVSLPCTRLTSLVNLTQRSAWEEAAFQKRQNRDLQRADEVASALESTIAEGGDVSWEWPTHAKKGWNSRAIRRLQKIVEKYGRHLFWCHFHGCAYGLQFGGHPVQKSWTVATTDCEVWLALQRRCPGHLDHVHCRGQVAQASSYYPPAMVKAVTDAIVRSWTTAEEKQGTSLGRDISVQLLEAEEVKPLDDLHGRLREEEGAQWRSFEERVRE